MSFELAFRSRVASIMETLTATALQDICQLMGETYAAFRVETVHEQNQSSKTKLQAMENGIGVENPTNCMERIQKLTSPTGMRNFPVVEQILNEQEANGLWLEVDPTVEDEGPPSLVPEGEEPAQPLSQTTDMGVETWPAPPVIKQEEMDDDDMDSQGYGEWIPETDKANQNTRGESDEEERSPASGGSKKLGVDDFKREQSPLLVSTEDAPAPTKKKCNKRYSCEICGKTENKKRRMTSHMITHTGMPFSCDICGEKFKFQNFLTRHQRSKHTVKTYSCSVCEKTFLQATSRDTHERGHAGKNYGCSDCGEMFKERGDRDVHECIDYKGGRPFSCSECSEAFQRQYHLKKHQLEKHPLMVEQTVHPENRVEEKSEKPCSCSVCGMLFVYPKSRDNHERKHIGEDYWCSGCGKTFKERQDRDTHGCIVYKGDRPFRCSECNEDFERQYHLKKHQLEKHPLLVDQSHPGHDT
uniref:C2H2-type domain-containing protein n=1 Tax=Hucho hucho TaxID=62062 RepID=A0A4W5Q551_9TELE